MHAFLISGKPGQIFFPVCCFPFLDTFVTLQHSLLAEVLLFEILTSKYPLVSICRRACQYFMGTLLQLIFVSSMIYMLNKLVKERSTQRFRIFYGFLFILCCRESHMLLLMVTLKIFYLGHLKYYYFFYQFPV